MVTLNLEDIIHWFNSIRNLPDNQRYRALEGMWDTQLYSKWWIVEQLNNCLHEDAIPKNIYIFGGWTGILSSMLFQRSKFSINKIRSIDIDPWCESIADTVCKPYEMNNWRFKAVTGNMADYVYETNILPDIVINTSTEHVSQKTYDTWYEKIPNSTMVIAQGNNFFLCKEHVRCTSSLNTFLDMNYAVNPMYIGELPNNMYTRYMAIWRK